MRWLSELGSTIAVVPPVPPAKKVWSSALCAVKPNYAPGDPIGPVLKMFGGRWQGWPWAPHTVADPFLFVRDDRLFLFAEIQFPRRPGAIACWSSADLEHFEAHGTVLEADTHLSYPFVREWGGEVYMIPESSEAGEIALYRFADFPRRPEKVRTLLKGAYVDSATVDQDGITYLFTSSAAGFEIFWTRDLLNEPLQPHPLNPIAANGGRARCGGAPFRSGGRLYRLVENGGNRYGEVLSALVVERLSPDEYHEEMHCFDVLGSGQKWNHAGGHHLSVVRFKGMMVAAVDGQADEPRLARLAKWPARVALRRPNGAA